MLRTGGRLMLAAQLSALALVTVSAVDVEHFGVFKRQAFSQTGAGAPVPLTSTNYSFLTFARAKAFNTVRRVRILERSGVPRDLVVGHDFAFYNLWSATDFYPDQASLDAAHPNGTNTVVLETVNDGMVSVTFTLTGNGYPSAPHVSNFAAAQALHPGQDFRLAWDPFVGGTTNDHIRVEVEDPGNARPFRTADPRDVMALDGTATSVVIPRDVLTLGHTYKARLTFVHPTSVDTNSYPEVTGVAGYAAFTEFTLHTVDLHAAVVAKGQAFQQTNGGSPVSQGFELQVSVDGRGTNSLVAAGVQVPNGPSLVLQATNDFNLNDTNATSGGLDAVYPDGIYQVNVTTAHDGSKVFNLPVTNIIATLPTPRLSNFATAQAINPSLDFTVAWDAFAGGTVNDFVQFQLQEMGTDMGHSFKTPRVGEPGAFNGTNTSVTIPAYTLKAGRTYSGSLLFGRLSVALDTNTYPGAVGVAASFKETDFNLRTPDVRAYSLVKRQEFLQTNNLTPVAASASNFVAVARVQTLGSNNLTNATIVLPGNAATNAFAATNDFTLSTNCTSQAALDASFPSGVYTFNLGTTGDGNKSLPLTMPPTVFPNVPQVLGYDLAQAFNPHRARLLVWNSFTGGTASDHIRFDIVDTNSVTPNGNFLVVFESPQPGEYGALTGTNNGVLLPADTLQPGKDYLATLHFVHMAALDTNSYPGSVGSVRLTSLTTFNIHTRGSHPSAPLITSVIRTNAQTFLNFFGEAQRQHRVEFVTDLKVRNWSPLATNSAPDGAVAVNDNQPGSLRFYRVVPLFR